MELPLPGRIRLRDGSGPRLERGQLLGRKRGPIPPARVVREGYVDQRGRLDRSNRGQQIAQEEKYDEEIWPHSGKSSTAAVSTMSLGAETHSQPIPSPGGLSRR